MKSPTRARKTVSTVSQKSPRKINGLDHKTVKTLEKFSSLPDLLTASGMAAAGISSATISRYKKIGWLLNPAPKEYRRTAKFPRLEVPAAAPSSERPSPSRANSAPPLDRNALQTKLANALKQRDHARENGREQMESIFQKEVDQLEAQLS